MFVTTIAAALANNRCPFEPARWDSWKSNFPSVRVAEKLGFQPVQEYRVLFIQ